MRDFVHQIVYSAICSFFWVLQIVYSQDAPTDFDAKYVKRHSSAQGCALWVEKPKVKLYTLFCPQNRHYGALFRRDLEVFARKRL